MLSPERQSAQMSKITNDGLTRSGTGYFIRQMNHMATVGVKGYFSCALALRLITLWSKHWRRVVSHPDSAQSHQAHLTTLQ